jgi:hypothetical protein
VEYLGWPHVQVDASSWFMLEFFKKQATYSWSYDLWFLSHHHFVEKMQIIKRLRGYGNTAYFDSLKFHSF